MFMYPITDIQNRYLFTVIKSEVHSSLSVIFNKQLLKIYIFMSNLIFKLQQKNILFIKSIISNTDINNKQNNV